MRHGAEVFHPYEPLRRNQLRFLVQRRVEDIAVVRKADRYDVRPRSSIERGKPRDSRLPKLSEYRGGNLTSFSGHGAMLITRE